MHYLSVTNTPPLLPPEKKWVWCLTDFLVLWYMPHLITRRPSCVGLSPVLAQLCTTFFYLRVRLIPLNLLKHFSICISFADSSKAVQILSIIFLNLYFMVLCWLHLEIYMLKSWPSPCTMVVCVGKGGGQSRRCSSGIDWVWDCRVWNIQSHSRKFAMLRLCSYLCAPNRIKSLLFFNGRKQYCLREQTHSSELQLVFVNHSQQIVLYRHILRLCIFLWNFSSEFAWMHKFTLFGFAYVWGGL